MTLQSAPSEIELGDKRSRTPIYDGIRTFLGRKDLVLSFYTMKCQFLCTYCALPFRSANKLVSVADLNAQIDAVLEKYRDRLSTLQQVSFGNEGSALDTVRFHRESLHRLLDHAAAMPALEVLSIETRPEYLHRAILEEVRSRVPKLALDVTVGFETQDEHIRLKVLNKNISRKSLEDRIALLGELRVGLTSYVMIKPAPNMTEAQGVAEATATIDYLAEVCGRRKVAFTAYLTPSYIAQGSELERTKSREEYVPPTIQSVYRVLLHAHKAGIPAYAGVWNEGLAEEGNDFRAHAGYDPELRKSIVRYNKTKDFTPLLAYVGRIEGT